MALNVNTNAVIKYTVKLEQLTRSAFPSAIRGSLNKCAYDLKTKTMPKEARNIFVERDPRFFIANSKFENATGFNINSMKSTVGFVENNLRDKPNEAVQELQQQETGGSITHKSFIALPGARTGNSFNKKVRANARLKAIKNLKNIKDVNGKNFAEKLIKTAAFVGKGGLVLAGKVVYKIDSIKRQGKDTVFKKTKLYSFKKNRSVNVHATHFMHDASLKTHKKIEDFYIQEALRQIAKYK